MCLVCGEQIANLQEATGLFTKLHISGNGAGKTSFVISNKPSSEEFIKECLVAVDDSCDDPAQAQ